VAHACRPPHLSALRQDLFDAKRILRELKLLRHLGGHENVIWVLVRERFVCTYQLGN